jgi:hypothetical protein
MRKLHRVFPMLVSLLAPILLGVAMSAQTKTSSTVNDSLPQDPASVRQSVPQQNDSSSNSTPQAQDLQQSQDGRLVSQFEQCGRCPRESMSRGQGRYYPSYPPAPAFSPVGALIGLGIGGTLGALAPSDHSANARFAGGLIGGGLGALMGGAIGGGISATHAYASQRHWRKQRRHDAEERQSAESDLQASNPRNQTTPRR